MKGIVGFQIATDSGAGLGSVDADDLLDTMKRLETSATITRFRRDQNLSPVRFLRNGLGFWTGFVARTVKGPLIIAASENRPQTGASIWAPQLMTLRDAAALVTRLAQEGDPMLFMTPEGRMIKPADSSAAYYSINPPRR